MVPLSSQVLVMIFGRALIPFCIHSTLKASLSYSFVLSETMLIRIRHNFGTFKVHFDDEKAPTLRDVVESDNFEPFKVVQALSFDPSGKNKISKYETLEKQGIKHGSMIYCRLEERSLLADSDSDSSVDDISSDSNPKRISSQQEVINLVDSSDEEETRSETPRYDKKRSASTSQTFDSKRARVPAATSQTSTPTSSSSLNNFRIASYNVWFGTSGDEVYPRERMNGIAQVLQEYNSQPDSSPLLFVGFQELTMSLKTYLVPHLKEMGFNFANQPLEGFYGVGIAISNQLEVLECQFVPFPTGKQGRGILYARTKKYLFVTTHLESYISKDDLGVDERETQIKIASDFCQEKMEGYPELEIAIIAGDFNWDDERTRGQAPNQNLVSLLQDGWKDAGKKLDHTYDGKENAMLTNKLRRRLDRCIYLTNKHAQLKQATLLGKDPIPNLVWKKQNPYNGSIKQVAVLPSDHFGIGIQFKRN